MTVKSRKEFEHNMHMLSEGFRQNRMRISSSVTRTIKGIENARLAPNRRVNLHTVDEAARLMANTFANMSQQYFSDEEELG